MVASRQVGVPFCGGFGRQRGGRFRALAQDIGRTAISILRKYSVTPAKLIVADLLEFAAPEIAEVVIGRKNFTTAAKCVARQTLRKQSGSGSRKKTASRLIPTKSAKKPFCRQETFLQTFVINHGEHFTVPTFCGNFRKS